MTRPVMRPTDALPEALPDGILAHAQPRLAPPLPDRDPPPNLVDDVRRRALTDGATDEEAEDRAASFASRWQDRWKWSGRVCSTCEERKPLSAFGRDPRTVDNCKARCRDCDAARARWARRKAHSVL